MEEAKRMTYNSSVKGYDNLDKLFEDSKARHCTAVQCFFASKNTSY